MPSSLTHSRPTESFSPFLTLAAVVLLAGAIALAVVGGKPSLRTPSSTTTGRAASTGTKAP